MTLPASRGLRLPVLPVAALVCALLAWLGVSGPGTARAATPVPPAPALPAEIEDLASWVPNNSCSPATRPGTARLGRLLVATYPNTRWGGARACGTLPNSEHSDGRALDWMNSVRDPVQAAQAQALITWLFATDQWGNRYANARRLGVMYLIWNNKIWGAYSADRGWRAYSSCASHPERSWDTTCHRDHVHFSLSWAGAMARTSFWTGQVAGPDYGRCRPRDLNWAYGYKAPNPTPCRLHPVVKPPVGASTLLKTLTTYSGRHLVKGSRGAPVTAVQKAFGVTPTGYYGPVTAAAVRRWQTEQGLTVTGTMNYATWRALLADRAPAPYRTGLLAGPP